MATNDLIFTRNARNWWESKFVSSGNVVTIQIQRAAYGSFVIYANLPGMKETPAGTSDGTNILFAVDFPEGVEVTIESMTEITSAKILG